MEKLKNKILLFAMSFCSIICFSQIKTNLIIIIDDQIVTNGLMLKFIEKRTNAPILNFVYTVGKEVQFDEKNSIGNEFLLEFNYLNNEKEYHYYINLMKGTIVNTPYLIVRIYNMDKKIYRKRYCDSKERYVVEFQNSTLYGQIPICK